MRRLTSRGDTIVEVMLSLALLSAILFSCWAIVNKSTQITLTARQRIVMVNALKEQAEILNSFSGVERTTFFSTITSSYTQSETDDIAADPCQNAGMGSDPVAAANSKFFHYRKNNENSLVPASGFSLVRDDQFARVWIQYISRPEYVDFYVRACWYSAGGVQNQDNSQFIVRMNR
jgi:hypothetical protein